MKQCTKCKGKKEPSEFYKDKRCKDGLKCWCKECLHKYRQSEPGKEVRQKYRQSGAGRESSRRSNQKRRLLHPEKAKANDAVRSMVRAGKITQPFLCERCFKECKPEAHHPDYTKPMEIEWLCRPCHIETHKEKLCQL
ncbi:hypothetical protein LCGC14_2051050 [marine sediment metagenome]|uniref:Uncharacterized protein n=1 Tax=marine sediment metagenome TaxID=412755 RepID=A0A0F9H2I7_9ZZZZ